LRRFDSLLFSSFCFEFFFEPPAGPEPEPGLVVEGLDELKLVVEGLEELELAIAGLDELELAAEEAAGDIAALAFAAGVAAA
jgi:hypothetical protein